jgi:ABC-type protease/lipase transport system fused ATPase/permease subunit
VVVLAVAVVSRFVNVMMLSAPVYLLQIYGRVSVSRNHDILIFLRIAVLGALMVVAALDFTRSLIVDLPGSRRAWMRVNWVFRHEIPN